MLIGFEGPGEHVQVNCWEIIFVVDSPFERVDGIIEICV